MLRPLDRRSASGSAGQGLVEMALALPVFLLVLLAIIEGAGYAFAATTLQHAAHEGARLAALPSTAGPADVTGRVIARAMPVELRSDDISVGVNSGSTTFVQRETGDRVRVSVRLDYVPLTVRVFGFGFSFTLAADAEYFVE